MFTLKVWACGALGGSINSIAVTPVEFLRNNLIVLSRNVVKSPTDLAKLLYQQEKSYYRVLKHLYGAFWFTALRDGIGTGFYFLTFNTLKNLPFLVNKTENSKPKRFLHLLVSGSCSGMMFWITALPFDCIKTKLQVAHFSNEKIRVIDILRSYNLKQYYTGWQVAIGRGIPGAATTLTIYTLVTEKLDSLH